ncbi:MAG: 4-hydroxythreonine-4-phosphate dehydrogenase PdxA [Candidatus Omnitrophica bacterium]|nr:4-hydroxythreonine-4-phosphate dehydrogenase PdxA [Candidatus Omnitrophota bacterium]
MSRSRSRKVIGITLGDPAGIGPEVIARSLLNIKSSPGTEFLVIGNRDVFARVWPKSRPWPLFLDLSSGKMDYRPGCPTILSGRDSLLYLDKSIEMLKSGTLTSLVTGPVSKEAVSRFVSGFRGHTSYLADAFGRKDVEMLFVAPGLKMVLVTRHIPLRDVPGKITRSKVKSVIVAVYAFLRDKFGIASPRVAVCGLNPHAGEGGQIGREDVEAIVPAIKDLKRRGWDINGPFPADTLFEPRNRRGYDLIVTMYHDQGLTAVKAEYFSSLVNLTVGLPFIRTSPAHGTAFGIAGQKGTADHRSMLAAIRLAMELT